MEAGVSRQGFTLVEVLVTTALSFLVFATLFSVYYWGAELSTLCGKKNRSQVASINSSVRIMDCIRNASAIMDIDDETGRWVKLGYSDGQTALLAYTNSAQTANSGALGLFRSNKPPVWLVKHGITEMMGVQGFDSPVFSVPTNCVNSVTNRLYVRYRVSQPADDGGRDLEDKKYAMHVRFAACLRNVAKE